jgi:phage-related protein
VEKCIRSIDYKLPYSKKERLSGSCKGSVQSRIVTTDRQATNSLAIRVELYIASVTSKIEANSRNSFLIHSAEGKTTRNSVPKYFAD